LTKQQKYRIIVLETTTGAPAVFFYAQNQPLKSSRKIMNIKLNKPFAANSAVDEFDVRQMKKALNRLGYYQPYEKTGITDIPDAGVFSALKSFQKDQGLQATGTARPGDETVSKLSSEAGKKKSGKYIWRTVGDSKVRDSHAELDGTVRDLADSPDPGEEFNCRCWAEPVNEAQGLRQEVISSINDAQERWTDMDFVLHFFFGGGKEKTLEEIGLLGPVIDHAKQIMFDNVLAQVADRARLTKDGPFTGSWNNSYPFGDVVFSLGGVTIKGRFGGTVKKVEKTLVIEA
jgi:SPP1 gp7 family putative phage head morphogenesis protein